MATINDTTVEPLVITRTFDAPRELVFQAWTDQRHMAKWMCCATFTVMFAEADVRVGGTWRSGMRSPEGRPHIAGGVYREIVPYERLVLTHAWENEHGTLGRETLVTVLFTERGGKTTMTFTQVGLGSTEARDSHYEGWTQSFDHLANVLRAEQQRGQEMQPQEHKMEIKPEKQHEWLQKLVGEWTYETEVNMGPGKEMEKFTGTESVRSIGWLWIQAEGRGAMPGGGEAITMLTLGYDPQKKSFVGTWFGSMMSYLWTYTGSLDEAANRLTLDTVGPDMAVEGKMAKYRETITIDPDGVRRFTSEVLDDAGKGTVLVRGTYRRAR